MADGGARRVVSLVPSWTETVFALGRGDTLVGCTRYCVEPRAALHGVPRVGGTKNPQRPAIEALAPDLVLVNTEENRAEDIAWLRARYEVYEAMPRTVADAARVVRELGARLAAEAHAAPIVAAIAAAAAPADEVPVRVFYPIWPKPWLSINRDTYIHDVLTVAGAVNVCADRAQRYPEVSPDALAELDVDVVLLPDEPWEFTAAERDALARQRRFGAAPLQLCSGKDACWHGARTATGVAAVRELLRPYRPPC